MRFRRVIGLTAVAALSAVGTALVNPASAAHLTIGCGSTITQSTTLTSNIGPCTGDGLIVTASNITLDLGGRTVSGANSPDTETVGVRLVNVTGVTVRNGTVTGFDAGVGIFGGSGNAVQAVTARDNINDKITLPSSDVECDLGDGITVMDSSNNRIDGNTAVHNGPFSGISLVGDSNGNRIRGNKTLDNNVDDVNSNCGRRIEDIGIRIEGPGADGNRLEGNTVTNNGLAGISLQGFVASPPPGQVQGAPNTDNQILGNTVTLNGQTTFTVDSTAGDGIAVLQQGPATIVSPAFRNTITGNNSSNNFRNGIFISANSANNTINSNTVNNNGRRGFVTRNSAGVVTFIPAGIGLNGPRLNRDGSVAAPGANNNTLIGNRGTGNFFYDGADFNANCDNNRWIQNLFGTVNMACVAANGGTGTVVAPPT